MCGQVVLLRKLLVALTTQKPFVVIVNAKMPGQVALARKAFGTGMANIGFFTCGRQKEH